MFLSHRLQNQADSDKNFVLIVLNIFATEYCKRFPRHLNNVSAVPGKTLKFVFFVKVLMLDKRNSRNFDFDFNYCKRCNFLTLTSSYGKFNKENVYQILSESVSIL